MLKKLCLLLAFILMVSFGSISAYSASDDGMYDKDAKSKASYVTVTKPDGNVATYNKSYIICGVTEQENVRVKLLRFNEEKKKYEDIVIDKVSQWDIGESGFFSKEIDLPEETNKIRFIAYKKDSPEVFQKTDFEIKVVKKNFLEDIKEKISEKINDLFTDKKN